MSWDIFVQDLPCEAKSLADIPHGFKPAPIGKRDQIIEKILQVVPNANFSDPSWGTIDGEEWSIEVNIGKQQECTGFAFHVRGGPAATEVIATILHHLNLRAIDAQTGDFFVAGPEAQASFQKWQEYRNRAVDDDS